MKKYKTGKIKTLLDLQNQSVSQKILLDVR